MGVIVCEGTRMREYNLRCAKASQETHAHDPSCFASHNVIELGRRHQMLQTWFRLFQFVCFVLQLQLD